MTLAAESVRRRSGTEAPDPIETLLRELVVGQQQIIRLLEGRQPRVHTGRDEALMLAVAAAVGDRAFTASDVIRHAALVSPDLRQALEASGAASGRKLGKLFRRIEGQEIGGVRLERIGQERDGVVWRLRVSRVS